MPIRPGSKGGTRPPYVGMAAGDAVEPGLGIETFINTGGIEEIVLGVRDFYDDFTDAALKPFWQNTPVITSLDWQLDAVNDTLDGIAENNVTDVFRVGIEGDFDVSMRIDRNAAVDCGFLVTGGGLTGSILNDAVNLTFAFTAQAPAAIATPGADIYVRMVRRGTTITALYKVAATDQWDTLGTWPNQNMGQSVTIGLNSATGAEIHEFYLWDNQMSQRIRGEAQKVQLLTDAATIVVDAALGNEFRVVLGGNRTLGLPTNPVDGQRIMFKVEQDGVGGRTLAFNAGYRFSTDLPLPVLSVGANAVDLLGFRYDADDVRWDFISQVTGF